VEREGVYCRLGRVLVGKRGKHKGVVNMVSRSLPVMHDDFYHDGWFCIYYIIAAGNTISSQLSSHCQGNW
jgi:hypothetical protein